MGSNCANELFAAAKIQQKNLFGNKQLHKYVKNAAILKCLYNIKIMQKGFLLLPETFIEARVKLEDGYAMH